MVLQKKVHDIEAMEAKLKATKSQLQLLMQRIVDKPEGMACADNARRVLDEMQKR